MSNAERAEIKAKEYALQAEKKLKAFSFWGSTGKYESAVELYDKAAAQYKIAKLWDESGEAYVKCAEYSAKIDNTTECLGYYVNAAKSYKNSSPKDAVQLFRKAAVLHMDQNRFSTSAKLYKEIGELEQKAMNNKEAIDAWQEAAECYVAENSAASARQCFLNVADLSAEEEDYKRAIGLYVQIATEAAEGLGKYSVKDYIYKALLCHLAMGAKTGLMSPVELAYEKYQDTFATFEGSRECKFIGNLITSFKEEDIDQFTEYIFKFDQIMRLSAWASKILYDVKLVLKNGPESGGRGDDGEEDGEDEDDFT